MAQIIDGGTLTFDALVYGKMHSGTQNFLASKVQDMTYGLTDAGRRFMSGAQDLYERVSGSEAARMLRAAGRAVSNVWRADDIRTLIDIGSIQHAGLQMQRWIMAEPTIRSLYHKEQVDGYSDTYVDMHPGVVGESHYDYRRAMDGLVMVAEEEDEEGEFGWSATTYFEDLYEDDNDLDLEEQLDIQDTWRALREHILRKGDDPTSKFNAAL